MLYRYFTINPNPFASRLWTSTLSQAEGPSLLREPFTPILLLLFRLAGVVSLYHTALCTYIAIESAQSRRSLIMLK